MKAAHNNKNKIKTRTTTTSHRNAVEQQASTKE